MKEGIIFADKYVLLSLLGRGGFSEVWLARDNRTQMNVAIKAYMSGTGLDSEGVKMFTQEFSIVTGMNHTNLLRPTYFDEWNGIPYLVLPYCSNGSACRYINKEVQITERDCWQMLCDVASGLAYLHSLNPPVIHQDIKPDNILISDSGRFMITDFGISTRIRRTLSKTMDIDTISSGTMAYMGPERFSKERLPVKANDIWSLGAMMYELMTGDVPFGNEGGLFQKAGAEIPVVYGNNYSEDLKRIVYLCLDGETYNRPTAHDISDYAEMRLKGFSPIEIIENQENYITRILRNIIEPYQPAPSPSHHSTRWKIVFTVVTIICILIAISLLLIHCNSNVPDKRSDNDSLQNRQDTSSIRTKRIVKSGLDNHDRQSHQYKKKRSEKTVYIYTSESTHKKPPVTQNDKKQATTTEIKKGRLDLGYARYYGDILDGKPHGKGVMHFQNDCYFQGREMCKGDKLEGTFEHGLFIK